MIRLKHWLGIALGSVAVATGAAAQDGCIVSSRLVYNAGGSVYRASLRECASGATELGATGRPVAADGTVLAVSMGRVLNGQPVMFFKGQPTASYAVRPQETRALDLMWSTARRKVSWSEAARVLPFVPETAIVVGEADGYRVTGYTDLHFLPSLRGRAAALGPGSIIVAVDGFKFSGDDDLAGYLTGAGNDATDNRFLEVLYFDRNERPAQLRRTFVQVAPRRQYGSEWDRTIQSIHARADGQRMLAAAGVLASFYVLWSTWHSSGMADWWEEETRRCRQNPLAAC